MRLELRKGEETIRKWGWRVKQVLEDHGQELEFYSMPKGKSSEDAKQELTQYDVKLKTITLVALRRVECSK